MDGEPKKKNETKILLVMIDYVKNTMSIAKRSIIPNCIEQFSSIVFDCLLSLDVARTRVEAWNNDVP